MAPNDIARPTTAQPSSPGEPNDAGDDTKDVNLDQTIEDSFPASDPPSSIPDPSDRPGSTSDTRDEP